MNNETLIKLRSIKDTLVEKNQNLDLYSLDVFVDSKGEPVIDVVLPQKYDCFSKFAMENGEHTAEVMGAIKVGLANTRAVWLAKADEVTLSQFVKDVVDNLGGDLPNSLSTAVFDHLQSNMDKIEQVANGIATGAKLDRYVSAVRKVVMKATIRRLADAYFKEQSKLTQETVEAIQNTFNLTHRYN